jgi:predicted dehydrogenase
MNLDQGIQPIRVAIIGTAARSSYLYGPMLKALPGVVTLVSVWGRTLESAKNLEKTWAYPGIRRLKN